MLIGEHLDLDVPGVGDGAFQNQLVTAERVQRLFASGYQSLAQSVDRLDQAHPPPSTARGRLHHEREAHLSSCLQQAVIVLGCTRISGNTRDLCGQHGEL